MSDAPTIDLMWGVEFEPADVTFKYSAIEQAIAGMHGIDPAAMKTFRSRVKHFQRIGLVPSSPGKGQKIKYTVGDAIRWALCFEFAELGLPPEQIKDVIRLCSRELFGGFRSSAYPGGPPLAEDHVFVLFGNFLQWHLRPSQRLASELFMDPIVGEGRPTFGLIAVSKVVDYLFSRAKVDRCIMINMSELKRKLGSALKIEWKQA